MENQTELKWYQKPAGVIILLIFFFPVGLYLMWKNELWTKQTRWIVTGVLALIVIANAGNDKNSNSNSGVGSDSRGSGSGDASCQYAVESNIEGAGGTINGIAHKGNGVFEALVASSTTNYKYKYVLFYTDSECNITNVVVK